MADEKILTFNLRRYIKDYPKWKRSKRVSTILKKILSRHLKSEKVKIDPELNKFIWSNGNRKPPVKLKVRITKENDEYKAFLAK